MIDVRYFASDDEWEDALHPRCVEECCGRCRYFEGEPYGCTGNCLLVRIAWAEVRGSRSPVVLPEGVCDAFEAKVTAA